MFFDYTLFPRLGGILFPIIQFQFSVNFYFSFMCHILFYCINLSAVFILTLLIIITSCTFVVVLHLCLYIVYITVGCFFDPCKDLSNVNKGKDM